MHRVIVSNTCGVLEQIIYSYAESTFTRKIIFFYKINEVTSDVE